MIKYDPSADLEYRSGQLASFLYTLGFSDDQIELLSIDDVINLIRDRYVYSHSQDIPEVQEYIKKQNIVLTRNVRRAWFDVQVSRYIKNVRDEIEGYKKYVR
jgi:hypothetical protein